MLRIVKDTATSLRARSTDVEEPTSKEVKELLDEMLQHLKDSQDPAYREANPKVREGVGLAAPQIMKRVIGNDQRYLIPASMLTGSILLLIADILSRVVMNGVTLPVGAITSIFGGPLFIYILLKGKEHKL